MTDCLRALDIEYVASCPGSTFRGFQESIINYGGNKKPEFLTALHEDSSVHFAMGYAKITGKPMAAMIHGVVGVQHASMAIYNAFGDQVPVYIIAGNLLSEWGRRPGAEAAHSSTDQAQMVRDYIKWDEQQSVLDGLIHSLDLWPMVTQDQMLVGLDEGKGVPAHVTGCDALIAR
jgi:thiamine pyrophosphate-dependent acetolactate synthase large subunit-like protein